MTSAAEPERYRVVDLVVDVADATVSRAGERIALPPRTFELLLLLVRRYPHLVRRHEILDAVWPNEHVTDQTLTHRVLLLRQALGDHAEAPSYVAGERGWGYRLLGPVARLDAPSSPATQSPRRAVRFALGAVALGCLLLTVADPRGGSRAASDLTLAVKPLSADGLSSEMRSLATDLTEALHARLAGLDGVRVLPWNAGASPPTLLLEGRVGTAGERLDVRLRLVDTATGRTVWSEGASGKAYQVLSGADTLIGKAASAAASRLAPAASPPAVSATSPQVRRLCLRGEFHWLAWDTESFAASRDAYEKAVALEPENAPAHAGLAVALCGLALAGREEGAEAAARQAAARARAIAPRDASTLLAAGLVRLLFDRDAPAAEAEMHRALEAAPGELPARMALALALQAQGRFEESVGLLRSAALVDPDAGVLFLQAGGLAAAGRCAEAIQAFEKAFASNARLGAARQGLAECLAATGRSREAARALGGPGTAILEDQWRRLCRATGAPAVDRVRPCVLAGESDRALGALREGERSRSPFLVFVAQDPLFAPLSARADFRSLLDEANPRRE
jgi:DNA-binding winged helix-turn-helix (wHTH) protein/tetratricopeptide (TPR) repeat protein